MKPGNIAFEGDEVTAVFDWEMATIGDPLADIGWIENTWTGVRKPDRPGEGWIDPYLRRYEELTGIAVLNREWYRALAHYKLAVILLVGGALLEQGHSDDLLVADAAHFIHPMTRQGLRELGADTHVEAGPVIPHLERVQAIRDHSG
jgi:Phosphotransferase enzyme family